MQTEMTAHCPSTTLLRLKARSVPVFMRAVAALAASLVAANSVVAQSSQLVSAQLSVLTTGIVANGGTINGFGIEPQLRVNGKYFSGVGKLSVGLGGQYTSHNASDDVGIRITGAFVEPRLTLAKLVVGRVGPYVAARIAVLHQSNDAASSSNGVAFGGGGGVAIGVNSRVNLDFGVAGLIENFGESRTLLGRTFIKGSMATYAVKFGVNIGLGS